MSKTRPSPRRRTAPLVLGIVLALGLAGVGSPASAWVGDNCHCPPFYVHCQERPPKICFKCVCPKPVCVPCDQPFWGYYPTCWRRWPCPYANCPDREPPWVCVPPPCTGPGCPGAPAPVASLPGAPGGSYGEGVRPGAGQPVPGPMPPAKSSDELPPLAPGAKPGARLMESGADQTVQTAGSTSTEPAPLFISTPGVTPVR